MTVQDDTLLDRDSPAPTPGSGGPSRRLRKEAIWAAMSRGRGSDDRLGRFRVIGRLGSGGMGVVFEAHDDTLSRRVAIKLLHRARDGRHRARLLREAQALAQLSHPNVVQVYEVGEVEDGLFIAMELVQGQTLQRWQDQRRPWRECLDVYRQAAQGLAAAHARGLVHRDFKPANCIVDDQRRVRVLDFGLVREVEWSASGQDGDTGSLATSSSGSEGSLGTTLTRTGAAMGTPAYMAPEQLRGRRADPRSDQFSLCASLFEALYGTRPFLGASRVAILDAIEHGRWARPAPAPRLPAVPAWLRRAVTRGLSLVPGDRFESIEALLEALRPPRRRWPWALVGAGVVGLLLFQGSAARPCEELRDAPVPGWAEEDAVAVEGALHQALPERADATWAMVRADLDAWTERWAQARSRACEQTRVHEAASEALLQRRNACLDRQQQRLAAMVTVLSETDASAATRAVEAVRSLPAPEPCLDAERTGTASRSLPPRLREAAVDIRILLARVWAYDATGRTASGLESVDRAVAMAEALGPEAELLHAEALYERGRLLRAVRRLDEARADLEAALRRAERHDDGALVVDVLRELMGVAGNAHDRSAADAWRVALTSKLERMADDPRVEAELAYLEGQGALRQEEPERAEVLLRRAEEAYAAMGAASLVERLHARIRLAWALQRQDRPDDARTVLEQSLELARDSELLLMEALLLEELGEHHLEHGDLEEAERRLRATLALRSQAYDTHAPINVDAHRMLAELLRRQGRVGEAIAAAEDARRSTDDTVSPSRRAHVHMLAASLHRQHDDLDAALSAYREARQALLAMRTPDEVELAMLDSNVADCQMLLGRLDEAEAGYARALATLRAHTEPDDTRLVFPLMGLGHLRAERDDPSAALPSLRAAWAIQREQGHNPELTAVLQGELGRALVEAAAGDAAQRREGLSLVGSARRGFETLGARGPLEELEQWMSTCGPACAEPPARELETQR